MYEHCPPQQCPFSPLFVAAQPYLFDQICHDVPGMTQLCLRAPKLTTKRSEIPEQSFPREGFGGPLSVCFPPSGIPPPDQLPIILSIHNPRSHKQVQ